MESSDFESLEYKESKRIIQELSVDIFPTPFSYRQEPYFLLATKNLPQAEKITIILPGIPEKLAFWSYSLLNQGKTELSSKFNYFQTFLEKNWRLITLAPHLYDTDLSGENYLLQLAYVLTKLEKSTKVILLGYSFGGKQLYTILNNNPDLQNRVAGLVFLDPVSDINDILELCHNLKKPFIVCLSSDYLTKSKITINESFNSKIKIFDTSHGELPSLVLKNCLIDFVEEC
ncbi:MAG: alpha/beta fold hydrolase [Candidatus Heimdallarchaeaceae archaeon]